MSRQEETINALDLCNICDGQIETPNQFGYCDEHLAEVTK